MTTLTTRAHAKNRLGTRLLTTRGQNCCRALEQIIVFVVGRLATLSVHFGSTDVILVMNASWPSPFFVALPLLSIIVNANRRWKPGNEGAFCSFSNPA